MLFFIHKSEVSLKLGAFALLSVVIIGAGCSKSQNVEEGSADTRLLGDEAELINRIELIDSGRQVVQRDIDGDWYYGGMELMNREVIQEYLKEISSIQGRKCDSVGHDWKRQQSIVRLDGGGLQMPIDILTFVSRTDSSAIAVCAKYPDHLICIEPVAVSVVKSPPFLLRHILSSR